MAYRIRAAAQGAVLLVTVAAYSISAVGADPPSNKGPRHTFPKRAVLAKSSDNRPEFERIVQKICDPCSAKVDDLDLKGGRYFFRTTERKYVIKNGNFDCDKAMLGGGHYVFLTVPEGAFGRSLFDIYANTGYDALSILKRRGKETVGIVFRYPPPIRLSKELDGKLHPQQFASFVYVPTWKNAFTLFEKLAAAKNKDTGKFEYFVGKLYDEERQLVCHFQPERKRRVERLPYDVLRAEGGPDWQYRRLLETRLSMNPHFRGTGYTENTIAPADRRKGYPEFVGPNWKLTELAEYAVIDLGRMEFQEVHSP